MAINAQDAISLKYTPVEEIPLIHEKLVSTFASNKTLSLDFRRDQLRKLYYCVHDNETAILNAVYEDFHKAPLETYISELSMVLNGCIEAIENLASWAKPKTLSTSLTWYALKPTIRYDPLGTVLIIVPFNYPVQLALMPLIGALAAGNTVMLKLSENTPHTSALFTRLLHTHLDNSVVHVINGDLPQSRAATDLKFDFIFFTGGARVGTQVAVAAAKTLTPVVLELGGKSPAFVLDGKNMALIAKRIAYGRYMNAGQTCVAPDYLLLKRGLEKEFLTEMKQQLDKLYPDMSKDCSDYAHMISDAAFNRVKSLIDNTKGEIVIGGTETADSETRFIEPTVILDVEPDDSLMKDEIFGPVLPIVLIDSAEEGIEYVRKYHDHPLALYIFSQDSKTIEKIHEQVSSGSGMVNGSIVQLADPSIPFGGVGKSGMGAYHGHHSFETFSHKHPYMIEPFWTELATAVSFYFLSC